MTTEKHVELVYHGPHASVEIDAPDGGLIVAKRGEKFAVPAGLAEGLLAQPDNYERAHAPKAKPEAAPTPNQTTNPAPDAGDNKE